jgi:hypothetical protein
MIGEAIAAPFSGQHDCRLIGAFFDLLALALSPHAQRGLARKIIHVARDSRKRP